MTARRPILLLAVLAVAVALGADDGKKADKKGKEKDAKDEKPAVSWYARSLVQSDAGIIVWDYWSKGRKLRAETIVGGTPILTLVSGEFYTVIDLVAQKGVAIRRAPDALEEDRTKASERPFGREGDDMIERGAEFIRSENLSDRPTRMYRLTDDRGKTEVWITDDKRKVPVRVIFYTRDSGSKATTDYIDWIADLPLSDAFFEPDPRIELERVEYADYVERSHKGPVGPAPVLFADLLHGSKIFRKDGKK